MDTDGILKCYISEYGDSDNPGLMDAMAEAIRMAQEERDEAREELDRLRRALDLALKFDWMRGTGKAREGAQ